MQKLEEMCGEMGVGPLFDAPPSLEQVDAVLDAVGGITGKTCCARVTVHLSNRIAYGALSDALLTDLAVCVSISCQT